MRQQLAKGGYATARDAVNAGAALLLQHREGTLPTDRARTLGQWLDEWLAWDPQHL